MRLADHESSTHGVSAAAGRHNAAPRVKDHSPFAIHDGGKRATEKTRSSEVADEKVAAGDGCTFAQPSTDFALALTHVAANSEAPGKLAQRPVERLALATLVRSALNSADGDALAEQEASAVLKNAPQTHARGETSIGSIAMHQAQSVKAVDLANKMIGAVRSEKHFEATTPLILDGEIPSLPATTQNAAPSLVAPVAATAVAAPHILVINTQGDEAAPAQTALSAVRSGTEEGARVVAPSPTHVLRLSVSPDGVGVTMLALRLRGDPRHDFAHMHRLAHHIVDAGGEQCESLLKRRLFVEGDDRRTRAFANETRIGAARVAIADEKSFHRLQVGLGNLLDPILEIVRRKTRRGNALALQTRGVAGRNDFAIIDDDKHDFLAPMASQSRWPARSPGHRPTPHHTCMLRLRTYKLYKDG